MRTRLVPRLGDMTTIPATTDNNVTYPSGDPGSGDGSSGNSWWNDIDWGKLASVFSNWFGPDKHKVRATEATSALQAALQGVLTPTADENGQTHGTPLQFLIYEAGNAATDEDKGVFRSALSQYYIQTGAVVPSTAAALLNVDKGNYRHPFAWVAGAAVPLALRTANGAVPRSGSTTPLSSNSTALLWALGIGGVAWWLTRPKTGARS